MTAPIRPVLVACLFTVLVAPPASADTRGQDSAARVRVIHASPDAPAVDVLVNEATALFTSARFADATAYAAVPANVYDIAVVPAGAGPGLAVIRADLNLLYGIDHTVVAVGTLGGIKPLVLTDDNEAPAGNRARIRFVHAVPDAPAVDIKVEDGPFLFQGLSFEDVGTYVTVPSDTYTLEIRVAGTDRTVFAMSDIGFERGGVYTMLATGLLEDSSLGALVVQDAGPPPVATPLPRLPARPLGGVELQDAR